MQYCLELVTFLCSEHGLAAGVFKPSYSDKPSLPNPEQVAQQWDEVIMLNEWISADPNTNFQPASSVECWPYGLTSDILELYQPFLRHTT